MSRTVVKITKRGKARVWSGHPWLFVDEIIEREKKPNGEIVRVEDENGKFIGQAFYSRNSKIALRFLSLEEKEIDSSFFEEKIINAVEIRKKITGNSEAYRLFFFRGRRYPGINNRQL